MTIEVPEELEEVLKSQAQAAGLSPEQYVCGIIERSVNGIQEKEPLPPFKTGFGMWKKYGPCPTDEEIAENRADMFRNLGEDF